MDSQKVAGRHSHRKQLIQGGKFEGFKNNSGKKEVEEKIKVVVAKG
jgi:hypothetical protein